MAREDIERAIELHSATPEYRKLHQKILDALQQRDSTILSQPASQPAEVVRTSPAPYRREALEAFVSMDLEN